MIAMVCSILCTPGYWASTGTSDTHIIYPKSVQSCNTSTTKEMAPYHEKQEVASKQTTLSLCNNSVGNKHLIIEHCINLAAESAHLQHLYVSLAIGRQYDVAV